MNFTRAHIEVVTNDITLLVQEIKVDGVHYYCWIDDRLRWNASRWNSINTHALRVSLLTFKIKMTSGAHIYFFKHSTGHVTVVEKGRHFCYPYGKRV